MTLERKIYWKIKWMVIKKVTFFTSPITCLMYLSGSDSRSQMYSYIATSVSIAFWAVVYYEFESILRKYTWQKLHAKNLAADILHFNALQDAIDFGRDENQMRELYARQTQIENENKALMKIKYKCLYKKKNRSKKPSK
jgi:hypothetical protein